MTRRTTSTLGRSRRVASGESTRDVVLDAAQICFARYGIARTTIDDVVRVAKVPRATLYRHAGGKEALIAAVSLRQLDRFLLDLAAHLIEYDSLADQIVEGALFTIEHYRSDELLKLLLAVSREPEGRQLLHGLDGHMRERLVANTKPWFEAARASGDLRPDIELGEYVEWTMRIIGSFVVGPTNRTHAQERALLQRMLVPAFIPDDRRSSAGV